MNLRENIFELIRYGYKYQYYKISQNDEKNKLLRPKLFFSKYQLSIIVLSFLIVFFNTKNFSENLSGYIISALALFIGLFFTFVFTLFDKYKSSYTGEILLIATKEEKLRITQNINFFKKVTYLTLYAILIAVLTIVLFSFNLIFEWPDPLQNTLTFTFDNTDYSISYAKLGFVSIYRFASYYFLFDFLLLTLYILGSIFEYLKGEYK